MYLPYLLTWLPTYLSWKHSSMIRKNANLSHFSSWSTTDRPAAVLKPGTLELGPVPRKP